MARHVFTAAERKKAADARKGKHSGHVFTAQDRAKAAASRKGHHLSAETRAKISAALRRRHGSSSSNSSSLRSRLNAKRRGGHALRPSATARLHRPKRLGAKSHAGRRHNTRHVTRGRHHGAKYRLISARAHHKHSRLVFKHRPRRTRIVVHRYVRHHRVWRKKSRR